ncbi:hypothetical protein H0G86_012494 [Trichoderma simmonsii]|uniref:Uncharacterized protein n=1 Tax=Trichoderma simmonsii TaxID=1491479 RepID=A0A8G0LTM7_9HYPO|nr:hypothetical protein H0G86_012494 [Trichoderma simmonsii]
MATPPSSSSSNVVRDSCSELSIRIFCSRRADFQHYGLFAPGAAPPRFAKKPLGRDYNCSLPTGRGGARRFSSVFVRPGFVTMAMVGGAWGEWRTPRNAARRPISLSLSLEERESEGLVTVSAGDTPPSISAN